MIRKKIRVNRDGEVEVINRITEDGEVEILNVNTRGIFYPNVDNKEENIRLTDELIDESDPDFISKFNNTEETWLKNWHEIKGSISKVLPFPLPVYQVLNSIRDGYYDEKEEHYQTILSAIETSMKLGARYARYVPDTKKFEIPEENRKDFNRELADVVQQVILYIVQDHISKFPDYYNLFKACFEKKA